MRSLNIACLCLVLLCAFKFVGPSCRPPTSILCTVCRTGPVKSTPLPVRATTPRWSPAVLVSIPPFLSFSLSERGSVPPSLHSVSPRGSVLLLRERGGAVFTACYGQQPLSRFTTRPFSILRAAPSFSFIGANGGYRRSAAVHDMNMCTYRSLLACCCARAHSAATRRRCLGHHFPGGRESRAPTAARWDPVGCDRLWCPVRLSVRSKGPGLCRL